MYLGDNLAILKQLPDESVDLIYIDPPFNTGRTQERKTRKSELSQDEHSQISECENEVPQSLESIHETNKISISESSDEMYQKITINNLLVFL